MKKILLFLIISFLLLGNINISFGAESCKIEEIPNATDVRFLSYNGTYSYILEKDNGKKVFIYNGIEGNEYYLIKNIKYSLDGSHYAYIAENQYGGNTLVIDGKELDKWYYGVSKINNFIYSPDGSHYAFITTNQNGMKTYLVKDGVPGKEYTRISNVVYSQADKDFKYVAVKGYERYIIVVKGIESREYKDISGIKYSPDGNHYAFITKKDNLKQVVVKDGLESKEYDLISLLSYSLFDNDFYYKAYDYNKGFILVKGSEEKEHKDFVKLVYSPNKKDYSYISFGGSSVVRNGIKDNDYYKILPSSLLYSPDGKSLSYIAKTLSSGKVIVKDGIESDYFINVQKILYSPDGKDFYYIAGNEKLYLFKNGINISKDNTTAYNIRFSEDGNHFYYEYIDSKGKVITSIKICNNTTTNNGNTTNQSIMPTSFNKEFLVDNKSRYKFLKQRILSKKELNKTFTGRRDISTIDLIVKKLSTQKLERLMGKLQKIDTSLVKFRKYKNMLDYLEAKVGLELFISIGKKDKSQVLKVIQKSKFKIEKPKEITKKIEKSLISENIIYYGYGNNSVQELKNIKLGDKVSIGTFSIQGDSKKQEFVNLKLKYKENGISINNMYLYDGLGYMIYGKNTGNPGEIEFPHILVGAMYGLYGKIGGKLNNNGEFIIDLLGIDRKNFKIETKNIGTVKLLGKNEIIKPELKINTFGLDYFYQGHMGSTTFALTFSTYNNKITDNIYLDKIVLNITNLLKDGNIILKNLQTGEEKSITGVPIGGNIIFDMKGVLVKDGSTFQIITSARGTFTIPKNGITYHTENGSIYSNNNLYQMGTNN